MDTLTQQVKQEAASLLLGLRGTFTAGSGQDTQLRVTTGEFYRQALLVVFAFGVLVGILLVRRRI